MYLITVEREYYAGWEIVGPLTNAGWTLPALSKVGAERMPEVVRAGIDLLLTEPVTR